MDEIICPECGHPNLPEAVKCWYCQHTLEKPLDNKSAEAVIDESLPEEDPSETFVHPSEDADIPDWLKRIRERVKTDQEIEEEEKWKQAGFFKPSKSEESAPPQKKDIGKAKRKSRGEKTIKNAETPVQETLVRDLVKDAEKNKANTETAEGIEQNIEDTDLPDGFIELDSEDE